MELKHITPVIIPGQQIHRAATKNSSMTSKSVLRSFYLTCSELTMSNDPVVKDKFSCSLFLSSVIDRMASSHFTGTGMGHIEGMELAQS